MGYAIYHVEKGKGNANAIGHHIDRTDGKEHSYRNADPDRKKNNLNYGVPKERHRMNLQDAVNARIKEGYKGKRAIRKDAVRYLKHVVTGSHKEMKEMAKDPVKLRKWADENVRFMIKEFGADNIVRCTLHMDEKTPHLHCVTVPLTQDGRLSAKEVLGGRKEMSARQDRYAEKMSEFGLKRGVKGTGIKHEDAKRYYGRIKENSRFEMYPYKHYEFKPSEYGSGLKTEIKKPSLGEYIDGGEKWEGYKQKQMDKIQREVWQRERRSQVEMDRKFQRTVNELRGRNEVERGQLHDLKMENMRLKGTIRNMNKKSRNKGKGQNSGMGLSRSRSINPFKGGKTDGSE